MIRDNVVVRVMAVRGGQVRLGIDAPESVRVRREELGVPAATGDGDTPARRPLPAVGR